MSTCHVCFCEVRQELLPRHLTWHEREDKPDLLPGEVPALLKEIFGDADARERRHTIDVAQIHDHYHPEGSDV